MNTVEIQPVFVSPNQPETQQFQRWIDAALQEYSKDSEIVVRIVDEAESAQLNRQYRNKEGSTNILSFPAELPKELNLTLLGDLVVCAPVIEQEAELQQKHLADHWAHIIVHGVLHLIGYDHINDEDAEIMEQREIGILQQLNITNPYL
jgi:probable rRNA maturation factor